MALVSVADGARALGVSRSTLYALARQRKIPHVQIGDRILVDVAQYRERRVAALGRFASQVALEVAETGEERALEPMSAADRKAVHDALSENETVVTRSEGEEPRRFVVVSPA